MASPAGPSRPIAVVLPMSNAKPVNAHNVRHDPEVRRLVQQQLVLLLHARNCIRRERITQGRAPECTLRHCLTMRMVLRHMKTCEPGSPCHYPHCPSSHVILSHWRSCRNVECQVCEPLRRRQAEYIERSEAENRPPPQSAPAVLAAEEERELSD